MAKLDQTNICFMELKMMASSKTGYFEFKLMIRIEAKETNWRDNPIFPVNIETWKRLMLRIRGHKGMLPLNYKKI